MQTERKCAYKNVQTRIKYCRAIGVGVKYFDSVGTGLQAKGVSNRIIFVVHGMLIKITIYIQYRQLLLIRKVQ